MATGSESRAALLALPVARVNARLYGLYAIVRSTN